jgi:N-acetyl-gamma-glutamyl-phosphate reductase
MMHINSYSKSTKVTVAVVGARGYAGQELVKLLLKHPSVQLTHAYATKEFQLSDEMFAEGLSSVQCLTDDKLFGSLTDIVFLATPAEVSFELAPKIMAAGKTVIDLSGAFRLKKNPSIYNLGKSAVEAEYGLAPFCGPVSAGTMLISNPGCYASAILLALIPLLKHGVIETSGLVIDAKSGTTGAGRKASETQLFAEVDGEGLPYRIGRHQHLPEIQEAVEKFAGTQIDPHFVTHLLPVKKGITAAIFATAKVADITEVANAYGKEFSAYPLVRHGEDSKLLQLKNVVGTPFAHIQYSMVGKKLYVFSLIDNLLKGAASQAVENLNRLLDLNPNFSLQKEG